MSDAEDLEKLRARMEAKARSGPFLNFLGIRLVDARHGYARLVLPLGGQMSNVNGTLHGGVISALADTAVGNAIWTVTDRAVATVDLHIAYIASPREKEIFAEGKIISQGRRIIVGEADILEGQGRLLARGRATYLVLAG